MQISITAVRRLAGPLGIAILVLSIGRSAPAQEEGGAAAPSVELDSLLKLPDSYSTPPAQSRGGEGPDQWRARFQSLRDERSEAQRKLDRAEKELDQMVAGTSGYSVSAMGASPSDQPVSFKLRQEMRRQRETMERIDREIRALEIEADLAGVPDSWRGEEAAPQPLPEEGLTAE